MDILTEPNADVWPFFTLSFVRKNVYKLTFKTRFIMKQSNSLYHTHFRLLSCHHHVYEDNTTYLLLEQIIISDRKCISYEGPPSHSHKILRDVLRVYGKTISGDWL